MLIVPPPGNSEQFLATTYTPLPEGGGYAFREPMSGEQMEPLVVPDLLRQWPVLKEGFDFLEQEGHRIDFSLLLSPHNRGQDIADAGIDLPAEAQRIATRRGILFLEGIHHVDNSGELAHMFNDVSQGRRQPDDFKMRLLLSGDIFGLDLLHLLQDTGARVEHPDIRIQELEGQSDLLGPIHAILSTWNRTTDELRHLPVSENSSRDLLIAEVGFHNYREWVIIGFIGACLSRFKDVAQVGPITGSLFMGSGHKDMEAKMATLLGHSIRVEGELIVPNERYAYHIMKGIGSAALSSEAVREFHSLRSGSSGQKYFRL